MRYRNSSEAETRIDPGATAPMRPPLGRPIQWLVAGLYALAGCAFVLDAVGDNNLAYGIIYTPFVATAVFHRRRWSVWLLAAAACLMVVLGAVLPGVSPAWPEIIGNRLLSIVAILVTAGFVQHARGIQERLAAQTRRAEAAERIKTDVL